MNRIFFLLLIFCQTGLFAQDLNHLLDSVLNSDLFAKGMEFSVIVHIDVPGINMPDKTVLVSIDSEGKSKIKGEGLLLLPQKGIFGQLEEFRKTPNQVIFLGNHADTVSYKIVSLDSKSDWITADVFIHKKLRQIIRMEITTRKYGTFKVKHHYSKYWYPDSTQVQFSALAIELPLKFMGKSSQPDLKLENSSEVTGKIILRYSALKQLEQ